MSGHGVHIGKYNVCHKVLKYFVSWGVDKSFYCLSSRSFYLCSPFQFIFQTLANDSQNGTAHIARLLKTFNYLEGWVNISDIQHSPSLLFNIPASLAVDFSILASLFCLFSIMSHVFLSSYFFSPIVSVIGIFCFLSIHLGSNHAQRLNSVLIFLGRFPDDFAFTQNFF